MHPAGRGTPLQLACPEQHLLVTSTEVHARRVPQSPQAGPPFPCYFCELESFLAHLLFFAKLARVREAGGLELWVPPLRSHHSLSPESSPSSWKLCPRNTLSRHTGRAKVLGSIPWEQTELKDHGLACSAQAGTPLKSDLDSFSEVALGFELQVPRAVTWALMVPRWPPLPCLTRPLPC